MTQTPILFVSDSPDLDTGLARIARDLAIRLCELPQFRVGFLGKGGMGGAQFPFPVMQIQSQGTHDNWGESVIHQVASEFFRGRQGIIFTVWDISRIGYIGWPEILPDTCPSKPWLMNRPFRLWGYFPVDCTNVNNRFPNAFTEAYNRYDRKLFYTRWARDLALGSGVCGDVDWIPHGISESLANWRRTSPESPHDGLCHIGCVATNQPRKDWGLVFGTVAFLKRALGDCKLWAHVDKPYVPGRWALQALARQFGLQNDTLITTRLTDEELWRNYSACDVTIAPGLGEGFGFPIAESLACAVPVIHGNYGGGADLLRTCGLQELLVPLVSVRIESEYGSIRPVFRPEDFAETILNALSLDREKCREAVAHLRWSKLFPSVWKRWFLRGLK